MNSIPRRTPAQKAWLLPAGVLFFMCGILLGRSVQTPWFAVAALALSLVTAGLSGGWRRFGALLLAAASLGTALGWRAYHPDMPPEATCTVRGTVSQEVLHREDGQVQSALTGVTLDGASWPDMYWSFYLDDGENPPEWLQPGAQVEMTARVYHPAGETNPGGFDFQEYLLQRGMLCGLYGAEGLAPVELGFSLRGEMAALRHDWCLRLMAVMGEEAGAYAAAMLLGTRDFIPEDDRAAFNDLGIAHILSVSGFHVGVLVGLMFLLLRPVKAALGWRILLEGAILTAYCLLTGGNAPVVRATLLLLWREVTRLRNKQVLPLHLLCVAALLQLVFNPTLLTGASFQLTYGAMLGLLLVFPRMKRLRACHTRWGRWLWEAFCGACCAQLGILLPQLYWFGELPLLSVALNIPLLTYAAGLITLYWATLAALPVPGLRELLGRISAAATELLLAAVRGASALPVTSLWTRQADVFTLAGWALVLFAASGYVPGKWARHRQKLLLLGGLLMALILVPLPENSREFTMFSVGDESAAVLQDGDMTLVLDVGAEGETVAGYLHQRRKSVDALIITHLHIDHASGIQALLDAGIPVEVCYLPAQAETPVIDAETLPILAVLRESGTEVRYLSRGDVIPLPSGQMTVLWPVAGRVSALHDANDVNLVLQAEVAGVTLLLPGDLSGAYSQYAALPSDVLMLAHHGSVSANPEAFLAAVKPQVLLMSNRLASREEAAIARFADLPLYTTDRHGAVTLRFLGAGQFTVETMLPR